MFVIFLLLLQIFQHFLPQSFQKHYLKSKIIAFFISIKFISSFLNPVLVLSGFREIPDPFHHFVIWISLNDLQESDPQATRCVHRNVKLQANGRTNPSLHLSALAHVNLKSQLSLDLARHLFDSVLDKKERLRSPFKGASFLRSKE